MTDESERKILLNPHDAARLPDWFRKHVQVSPYVPVGTAYVFSQPPILRDEEPVDYPRNPKAQCTITSVE